MNKQILQIHEQKVENLRKPGEDILNSLTPKKADMLHMVLGMAGELLEVDQAINNHDDENLKEELGDLLFYLTGLYQVLGSSLPTTLEQANKNETLVGCFEPLLDNIKKYVMYEKVQDIPVLLTLADAFFLEILTWLESEGFTLTEILEHNNEKLLKGRYKEGVYSDKAAQERADKTEKT